MRPGELRIEVGPVDGDVLGHPAAGVSRNNRRAEDGSIGSQGGSFGGAAGEIEVWRKFSVETRDEARVFPSERMTPLSKDNCWWRSMQPKLAKVGLGWANFLVMRRAHPISTKALGVDGKLVADPLGHGLDVSNRRLKTSWSRQTRWRRVCW
jgi:hypothetical protein